MAPFVQFDESRPVPPGHRVCAACHFVKPDAAFRRHASVCKGCVSLQDQAYYEANAECIRFYGVSLVSKEGIRARNGRYYATHADERKAYVSGWRRQHPEATAAHRASRRSRLRAAAGSFTTSDIRRLYADQEGLCYYCGVELHGQYHVDHKIALASGGSNWPSNLALACAGCNTSKGAKTVEQYVALRRVRGLHIRPAAMMVA